MKLQARPLIALAAFATVSALSHAGVRAVDVPRISNGGTGYEQVVARDTPRVVFSRADVERSLLPSGEASTMVNGQPNAHPPVASAVDTQVMGSGRLPATGPAMHPLWGTPD